MNGRTPDRRSTIAGAAALLLIPFFLWAVIFGEGRWRGWWLGIKALLLFALIWEWSKYKRKPPVAD